MVDKLLEMLNGALAEEWLAYYQYWIGARVMEGPMRSEIEAELLKHADEELEHAEMVCGKNTSIGRNSCDKSCRLDKIRSLRI